MNIPAIEGGEPTRYKFLSFSEPDISEEDISAATEVMRSGWLSTGKEATKLEEAFIKYKGGKVGAVALSSCTAALHLALGSLHLRPGDEVITTDFTFSATAASIIHAGGIPVLADCSFYEQNITAHSISEKLTDKTKAVVVVHFAGIPVDLDSIKALLNPLGILIIEDCAHAIESKYKDIPVGTDCYAGCFSFYGTKNITTAVGEGGMILSKHPRVIEYARHMSLHGMSKNAAGRYSDKGFKHYDILAPGYKYNMPDVSAAFCRSQLDRIDYNHAIREAIWDRYTGAFSDLPIYTPIEAPEYSLHARHLYTIQLISARFKVSRDFILDALTKEGIGVGVHYMALHTHTWYKEVLKLRSRDFPMAHKLSETTISLPLTAKLESQDIEDVIKAVRKVLIYYRR